MLRLSLHAWQQLTAGTCRCFVRMSGGPGAAFAEQTHYCPFADMMLWLRCAIAKQVGMEMYARWAHKVLWHDYEPGWSLHKSHHEPRIGPFEANDIYAIANALPAMALCLYG